MPIQRLQSNKDGSKGHVQHQVHVQPRQLVLKCHASWTEEHMCYLPKISGCSVFKTNREKHEGLHGLYESEEFRWGEPLCKLRRHHGVR